MNRIDEFADALEGWLVEWAEKRQQTGLTGGLETLPADRIRNDEVTVRFGEARENSGYVEEDGGFVSDWRDAEGITDASAESERFRNG